MRVATTVGLGTTTIPRRVAIVKVSSLWAMRSPTTSVRVGSPDAGAGSIRCRTTTRCTGGGSGGRAHTRVSMPRRVGPLDVSGAAVRRPAVRGRRGTAAGVGSRWKLLRHNGSTWRHVGLIGARALASGRVEQFGSVDIAADTGRCSNPTTEWAHEQGRFGRGPGGASGKPQGCSRCRREPPRGRCRRGRQGRKGRHYRLRDV